MAYITVFFLSDGLDLRLSTVWHGVCFGHKLVSSCLGGLSAQILDLGLTEDDVGIRVGALEHVWFCDDEQHLKHYVNIQHNKPQSNTKSLS